MSYVDGTMFTCDRCGEEKFIAEEFESWKSTSVLVEEKGWLIDKFIGSLCPDCYVVYNDLIDDFFGRKADANYATFSLARR